MEKKRKNPYNIEYVIERDNCSREEAIKTIQELKYRTSGSLISYQKRYGEVEGKLRYDEFCAKSANTKEKYKEKYGDNWEEKWNDYLKTKDSMSLEFHIKKYGKDLGLKKYQERLNSVEQSLDKMIERYGEVEGTKKFNEMNEKRSYSCSTDGLIEKFGEEKAIKINNSKALHGEKNGMYGIPPPHGSGNGWCGWYNGIHFRSILELSFMIKMNKENKVFKSAESKEFEIKYIKNGINRTYRPDFICDNKIIEIKPKNLINTVDNKLKFEAANKKFDNFVILTEDDIERINLKDYIDNGEVILTDRYKKKYEEKYL